MIVFTLFIKFTGIINLLKIKYDQHLSSTFSKFAKTLNNAIAREKGRAGYHEETLFAEKA